MSYSLSMAPKSKKKKKPVVNKEFVNKIKFLEKLTQLSLWAADGKHPEIDKIFNEQADRLLEQIQDLEEKQ